MFVFLLLIFVNASLHCCRISRGVPPFEFFLLYQLHANTTFDSLYSVVFFAVQCICELLYIRIFRAYTYTEMNLSDRDLQCSRILLALVA